MPCGFSAGGTSCSALVCSVPMLPILWLPRRPAVFPTDTAPDILTLDSRQHASTVTRPRPAIVLYPCSVDCPAMEAVPLAPVPCQAFTPDTHGHAASTPGTHGTRLHARPRREVIPLQYHRPTREWGSYRAISCLRVCPAMIPGVGLGHLNFAQISPPRDTRGDTWR